MKTYELTYIISPEITLEEAETEAKQIESAIQSKEGTILGQTNPLAKTLSYPIKKHASGFLGILEFQMEPEKLSELKEVVSKNEKIVRHMVIIKQPIKIKKQRRTRPKVAEILGTEPKTTIERKEEPPSSAKSLPDKSEGKGKVELKDIEQKIDEILGE